MATNKTLEECSMFNVICFCWKLFSPGILIPEPQGRKENLRCPTLLFRQSKLICYARARTRLVVFWLDLSFVFYIALSREALLQGQMRSSDCLLINGFLKGIYLTVYARLIATQIIIVRLNLSNSYHTLHYESKRNLCSTSH